MIRAQAQKQTTWNRQGRMVIDTGNKTFDRQTSCIGTGNQIGDTQLSNFIRPFNKTECNGFTNAPGHLQNYDLNWLMDHLPARVRNWFKENGQNDQFILYQFHHRRNGRKIIHGWVITRPGSPDTLVRVFQNNPGFRSQMILDECLKYITG